MTQSMELGEAQATKGLSSDVNGFRLLWSVWFDAPGYWSHIHPIIRNASEVKRLLFQTVVGTMLISVVSLFGAWSVGQFIGRRIPIDNIRLIFVPYLLILLIQIIISAAAAVISKVQDDTLAGGIPFTAGTAFLGPAYFISLCTALVVLLIVPVNPQVKSSSFLSQLTVNLVFAWPFNISFPVVFSLGVIHQTVKSGSGEERLLGVLQNSWFRILFGTVWMMMWAVKGAVGILGDWRYYPEVFRDLELYIEIAGMIIAILYGLTILAWHRQVRARHEAGRGHAPASKG
jgi:hypothetical protein